MPVHWCCHQLLYSGHYNSCFWERRRKISPGPFAGIDNVWIRIDLHRYLMSNARPKALLYTIGKHFGSKGLIGDGSRALGASKNSDGSQMQGTKRKILKTFLREYSGSRTTSSATCCLRSQLLRYPKKKRVLSKEMKTSRTNQWLA
jgi:hypothetical protein